MLQLQHRAGNRAVAGLVARGSIERWDTNGSTPTVQRHRRERWSAATGAPQAGLRSPVLDIVGHGRGRPLDEELRRAMEQRLGASFESVRLHVDARSTDSVDAQAYTVDEEIVVHPKFGNLRSSEGQKLLAHELAHVIQQRRGPVDGTPAPGGIKVSDPADRFERQADAVAGQQTQDGTTAVPPPTRSDGASVTVQTRVVAFKTGAEIDTGLLANKFFGRYILPKYKQGLKAEDNIKVHNAGSWDDAIKHYLKGTVNPKTDKVFTDDEAVERGMDSAGFRDAGEIHLHEERGQETDTVHESMHLFSADAWERTVRFNVNEGATEYFTRKLCSDMNFYRSDQHYKNERKSVDKLAKRVGEKVLADAYFNGEIKALKTKVDRIHWFGSGTWNKWLGFMKAAKYADADKLL
jgi:hypothetical protein